MRNLNCWWGRQSILPILVVVGIWMVTAVQSVAQAPQTIAQQTVNWKTAADAKAVMLSQVSNLNQQMPGFTEGTPLYDNALRRVAYFKAIVYEIDRGSTVDQALDNALPAAATLGYTKEASYTSKVILRALKEEAKSMVSN